MPDQPKAYTVTAISRMIKGVLEETFNNIWVEGEISNYINHSSGHRYFSLKDDNAVIKVTIWRSVGAGLKFEPENGQKVLAYGDIAVWEKGGNYQLNCRKMVPVGVGELELAFRQLDEKLTAEGLFDPSKKQVIPKYANKIGIVTSPTGAAIRDIIQISRRRNPLVEILIYPAKVQGDGAEITIAEGIKYFNSRDDIDLLIVGRGGGSLEDLWPFNTEICVRAVAASKIPIISAVGHEIDISLSDKAADLRAPTPSAAAELAVWSRIDFFDQVRGNISRQTSIIKSITSKGQNNLLSILSRPVFKKPLESVYMRQQTLDQQSKMLIRAGKNLFEKYKNRLSLVISQLEAMSPLKVLGRGYSVTRRLPSRELVSSITQTNPGDRLETKLQDGTIVSFIESILKQKK
ncbi:MAG: exodeoxyribonuclease VII large subunit [bacterium]